MKPLLFAALAVALGAFPLSARVVRVVVEHRDAPSYGGKSFGVAGPYETLAGWAYGELDPKDPLNAMVNDLALAPRNSRGLVEYSATFLLARPVDLEKASGVLLYEVPNRGNSALVRTASPSGALAGYLQSGHVILTSGWQGDLPSREGLETISVPIARNPDGSSLTGSVLVEFSNMPPHTSTLALVEGGAPRPPAATLETARALLTRRASEESERIPIDSRQWAFADCSHAPFPGVPDPQKICLKDGFDPAFLYELVYTAKDPPVLGIGFAATRDLVSYFKSGAAPDLPRRMPFAVAWGNSQSGNFLRTLVHLGFNQDEAGHIVFDGINDNIAVRQLAMNFRFAAPGGIAALYEPGSDGVLTWEDYRDDAHRRRTGGLLDRCRATNTCPKVFETFGASEFWDLRASPDLVGPRADRDIPLPPNVRRYYFPGVTHGGGRGGFSRNAPAPPNRCALPANPTRPPTPCGPS